MKVYIYHDFERGFPCCHSLVQEKIDDIELLGDHEQVMKNEKERGEKKASYCYSLRSSYLLASPCFNKIKQHLH